MKKISIKAYSVWTTISIDNEIEIGLPDMVAAVQAIMPNVSVFLREIKKKVNVYRISKRFNRAQVHELNQQLHILADIEFGADNDDQPFKKEPISVSEKLTGFTGCLITGNQLRFTNAPVISRQHKITRDPWD